MLIRHRLCVQLLYNSSLNLQTKLFDGLNNLSVECSAFCTKQCEKQKHIRTETFPINQSVALFFQYTYTDPPYSHVNTLCKRQKKGAIT